MIATITVGLMLIALVAAADLEEVKQEMLTREKVFKGELVSAQFTDAEKIDLAEGLKTFDKKNEELTEILRERWQKVGFNADQIEELISFFLDSQTRMKAAIEEAVKVAN